MICGRCGGSFEGRSALSRADNKTKLCSACGSEEAADCRQYARQNESPAAVREYLLSKLQSTPAQDPA